MAEHEPSIGATSDWYTPPEIFRALGLIFDLDPCSPGPGHWVPARRIYTKEDDGLRQPWHGLVFMNPPFGGRNGHVPWLVKFLDHANGIAIVRAYTSSTWFHEHVVPRAELLLFPKGKTKFVRPDGSVGTAPGHGVVLIGMGDVACTALRKSELGFCAVIVESGHVQLPFDWRERAADRLTVESTPSDNVVFDMIESLPEDKREAFWLNWRQNAQAKIIRKPPP